MQRASPATKRVRAPMSSAIRLDPLPGSALKWPIEDVVLVFCPLLRGRNDERISEWAVPGSNQRPPACKAIARGALRGAVDGSGKPYPPEHRLRARQRMQLMWADACGYGHQMRSDRAHSRGPWLRLSAA